jgi:hypothetical protein
MANCAGAPSLFAARRRALAAALDDPADEASLPEMQRMRAESIIEGWRRIAP